MLPRHRRQFGTIGEERRTRPRLVLRFVLGVIIVAIVWYLISTLFSFFDGSAGRKTAAVLTVQSSSAVQVSLQEGEWQNSESNLKLYAGDSVQTRGDGDATITLFDGTRIRLDRSTEITIDASEKLPTTSSALALRVKTGRIWVASPSSASFSGAIVRSISTTNYTADIPAGTNAIVSASLLHIARSEGLGVHVTFSLSQKNIPNITIGEGQYLGLTEDAKTKMIEGQNPYDFRDPVTPELLRDDFFVSSYVSTTSSTQSDGTTTVPVTPSDSTPLTLTSPDDNAKITTKSVIVSGKVGDLVTGILLNGSPITIKSDRSFSAELSLPKDKTFLIKVEAQDKQGITIGRVERTVQNAYQIDVAPVRIKSPVGSGETLRTSTPEVEITGEAPTNTAGIIVNDYRLQLFKAGSKTWSYLANTSNGNLKIGTNVFTIYAVDADGNKSPGRSITVILSTESTTGTGATAVTPPIKQNAPLTPGVLSVSAPSTGTSAETSDDELSITGSTSPDTYSVSVNGYALSLYAPGSTNWKYIASINLGTMKRGRNVYRIVARNQSGEILDVLEYTLTFKP